MISKKLKREIPLHLMILPGFIIILIYNYIPMAGIIIAFQKFRPAKGLFGKQEWVGLENFRYVMGLPNFYNVIFNTIFIATMKIIFGLVIPIVIAILINEVRSTKLKKGIQTAIYLPHFLSWVVLGGIFIDMLSPSNGIVGNLFKSLNMEPIFFLGDNKWFPFVMIMTESWKEFGYGTIIYLAAITGIDPTLYEAAQIDGASRLRQMLHVTLPGMRVVIVLLMVLSMGNILNAGFDQIFNLYSPPVYQSGDIIDTFVYRIGLLEAQYGVATAVGLFKSVVASVMISFSYFFARRFADYKIF